VLSTEAADGSLCDVDVSTAATASGLAVGSSVPVSAGASLSAAADVGMLGGADDAFGAAAVTGKRSPVDTAGTTSTSVGTTLATKPGGGTGGAA
jgi:hypothetical protein